MRSVLLYVFCIIGGSLLISACKSTHDVRPDDAHIAINQARDSIVILGRRHKSYQETEWDYVQCVGKQLKTIYPLFNIIAEPQFLNAMYPYFETSTAPLSVNNFAQLLQQPAFAQKVNDLKLKYIVWIDGNTETNNETGAISCAIGPGGGGCFGFSSWNEEANYQADVWDIEKLALTAQLNTTSTGTSYVPALIIPIPLLAQVQDSACESMATHIRQEIKS